MTGSSDTRVGKPNILLVEDDRLTRTVLRHDLKLCGFDGAYFWIDVMCCIFATV